jgi:hypothetical protein
MPELIASNGQPLRSPAQGWAVWAGRWLDMHSRWRPSFESFVTFVGGFWLVSSFGSSLLLNAYLKAIGQRGVPLDIIGTWAMLALMGGILVAALAVLAVMFVACEAIMQPLHPGSVIPIATRVTFFIGSAGSLIALLWMQTLFNSAWVSSLVAIPVGLALGLAASAVGRKRLRKTSKMKMMRHLALWIFISAMLFVNLAAELDEILSIQFSELYSFVFSLIFSSVQMILCVFLPRALACVLTVAGVAFVTVAYAPGPYAITLIALEATNQGGGLPAGSLISPESATLCNLGIADHPMMYRVATGCSKTAALAHLRQIASAPSSLKKAEAIAGWRCDMAKRAWRASKCLDR